MTSIIQRAPIVLFVFSRPNHTFQTIKFLSNNLMANESDLIVYADGGRNDLEKKACEAVRKIVIEAKGFRSVTLIEREKNFGLARNIIEGVGDVCKQYGRAIVLEDDLITSPAFLTYMNNSLDKYKDNEKIWHISGWNYPIDCSDMGDVFFLRVMNCWGWATWADRWSFFEKNTEKLVSTFDNQMIRNFDLDNSGVFWSQVLANRNGMINTWAIYWYATIFLRNGICLNPTESYVDNIGLDGSGTHGSEDRQKYITKLNENFNPILPDVVFENKIGIERIINFYRNIKPTLSQRLIYKLKSLLNKAGIL